VKGAKDFFEEVFKSRLSIGELYISISRINP